MEKLPLGRLIQPTNKAERDAIHIAIAPVTAGQTLQPGQKIGFRKDGTVGDSDKNIGVVDPFLEKAVKKGETFYICLFPYTIQSLCHHWVMEGFPDKTDNSEEIAKLQQEIERLKQAVEDAKDLNYNSDWTDDGCPC